ncbi:MAG: DnaB-like helicase C-terminal domain-containing protein [Enterocloster bolteae]
MCGLSSGVKSVGEIRRECQHMGADCIIIDYLQLIKAERHYANRASEVGSDISKAIKSLAMELNRPIIVLSQLNREHQKDGRQKEPTMSELRESGDIEQDASVVMLLGIFQKKNERYKGEEGERKTDKWENSKISNGVCW